MKYLFIILMLSHTVVMAEEPKFLAENQWPKSCISAVNYLISNLSEENKKKIRETPKNKLIMFHHGWGTSIRNNFGLWKGNKPLIESCASSSTHPDTVSSIIIKETWLKLNAIKRCKNTSYKKCKWNLKQKENSETQENQNTLKLQKKLKLIGLYTGALDGKNNEQFMQSIGFILRNVYMKQ